MTLPLATSTVASWRSENVIVSKFVDGPRSLEKAIVLPSGAHVGWMSPYRSLVSWRTLPPTISSR